MASATHAAALARQRSLLEFGKKPIELHTCPCCLNKTTRKPEDILKEVEAERAEKEEEKAARAHARRLVQNEKDRLFMETHVQVPKQSPKTGKWHGTEWIPKVMLETSWMIPRHVFDRIAGHFEFDKAAGCDLLTFRGKWARPCSTWIGRPGGASYEPRSSFTRCGTCSLDIWEKMDEGAFDDETDEGVADEHESLDDEEDA
ncbi:MAG: hypothetical protein GYA24_23240 [Candidatus Lokiarchaeota archaeon]|nr:hypothetical protein [Candidatus Lokiarchaeota archaeon]